MSLLLQKPENLRIVAVIPARYAASRFPGKVLTPILGKPMVQWVFERMRRSRYIDAVWVATDHPDVQSVAEGFGARVMMTSPEARSGTDRIAEAVRDVPVDIVVNIQGDEPMIDAGAVDKAIEPFFSDGTLQVSTLVRPAQNLEEMEDVNTARVIFDRNHDAIYFTRGIVPYNRDLRDKRQWLAHFRYFQHVGVYVYRKEFLLRFAGWPQTPLEKIEKLEQLRILEHGYNIRVVESDYVPICVDVPEDVPRVEALLKKEIHSAAS
jgi:3-deoxy-manno-octulosonate cytidylyltransferase (CMP-KDO synthetase)